MGTDSELQRAAGIPRRPAEARIQKERRRRCCVTRAGESLLYPPGQYFGGVARYGAGEIALLPMRC